MSDFGQSKSATKAHIVATQLSQKIRKLKTQGYDQHNAIRLAKEAEKFEWLLFRGYDREKAASLMSSRVSLRPLLTNWSPKSSQTRDFQQRCDIIMWLLSLGYNRMEAGRLASHTIDILLVMHDEECAVSGKSFRIDDFILNDDAITHTREVVETDSTRTSSKRKRSTSIDHDKQDTFVKQSEHKPLASEGTKIDTVKSSRVAVVKPTIKWGSSISTLHRKPTGTKQDKFAIPYSTGGTNIVAVSSTPNRSSTITSRDNQKGSGLPETPSSSSANTSQNMRSTGVKYEHNLAQIPLISEVEANSVIAKRTPNWPSTIPTRISAKANSYTETFWNENPEGTEYERNLAQIPSISMQATTPKRTEVTSGPFQTISSTGDENSKFVHDWNKAWRSEDADEDKTSSTTTAPESSETQKKCSSTLSWGNYSRVVESNAVPENPYIVRLQDTGNQQHLIPQKNRIDSLLQEIDRKQQK